MGLNSTRNYSVNFNIPKRSKKSIKFIIIHYTGMRNQSEALKRLCEFNSKVSAHYFIKNNGKLLNLVPDLYEAWHAGKSSWKNYKSLNRNSIGVEINNPGHENGYVKFKEKQLSTLNKLLRKLIKKYKIKINNILGHSDISPNRKKDPGEKFPWKKLAKNGLSIWHDLEEKKLETFRNHKTKINEKKVFISNLKKIGYSKNFKDQIFIIKAFQRRFRQNLINGKIDKECFLISKSLLNSS